MTTRTMIEDLAPGVTEPVQDSLGTTQRDEYGREPGLILSSIRSMGTSGTTTSTGQSDEDN